MQPQHFKALILTYKSAPVAIRERVSLNERGVKKMLRYMQEFTNASDVLVVSTCNRTELYYQSENELSDQVLAGLKMINGFEGDYRRYFQALGHHEAIKHLFEVAIGLDAQVIGDLQISGQVKNAYQWSADEGMAGPFLHRLLHTIFFVNKRVVQETSFRDGAASLSYATKEMVEDLTAGNQLPRVLILGVGEIGQDVVRNLKDARMSDVTILNRTVEKARKLAGECNFRSGAMSQLSEEIERADVVISSVSGDGPLVTKSLLQNLSLFSHKFFIDLSMPRSMEESIEEIPGVILYNLDDIRAKTNDAVEKRKASIPQVREIIDSAIVEFNDWSKEMIVSPAIQKIKNALEQIRKEEISRFLKNASPEEAARLEELSRSLTQKILKYPVLQLKAACKRGDPETIAEVLLDLFDIEKIAERRDQPKH